MLYRQHRDCRARARLRVPPRAWPLAITTCACALQDTEYLNLNQDYNAMDSDSCKQNCCGASAHARGAAATLATLAARCHTRDLAQRRRPSRASLST